MDEKTGNLISIESLEAILLDENIQKKLLDFENNRDFFLENKSYNDYYNALEDYVTSLLRYPYSVKNEEYIKSFVNNFLIKDLNKDKLCGSRFLLSYESMSRNSSLYQSISILFDLKKQFIENLEKEKSNYLEIFAQYDLVLTDELKKIMNNLICYYDSQEFVFNLFLNGNETLKNYIIDNYKKYFLIEKIEVDQLEIVVDHLYNILYSYENIAYIENFTMRKIKQGKEKYISDYITSKDERIVEVLKKVSFSDTAYISYLIQKLKNKDLITFECLYSGKVLSNFSIDGLKTFFKGCTQEKIITLLSEFETSFLEDGYSQILFMSLILNIEDKDKQIEYILKNIKSESKFNLETINYLVRNVIMRSRYEILNSSEFVERLNHYEMAFLLYFLNYPDNEIVEFIAERYNKQYLSYENIRIDYLSNLQNEVRSKNGYDYIKSLYLAWYAGNKEVSDYIPIEDILKAIFSNENIDRKTDYSAFLAIFDAYFRKNLNNKVNISFLSPMFFGSTKDKGHNVVNNNKININKRLIKNTSRGCFGLLETFFHEKSHYNQEIKMESANPNVHLIQMAKEISLYSELVYGNDTNVSENYCKMGLECDANLRMVMETFSFFRHINPDLVKRDSESGSYEKLNSKFKNFLEQRSHLERKDLNTDIIYDVDYIFDTLVSTEKIAVLMNKYPVLYFEYKENGEKKTIIDLFNDRDILIKNLNNIIASGVKINKADFTRRIRVYNELIRKRKQVVSYNNKIISNKNEIYNDWSLLIIYLGGNKERDNEYIDYLIDSIKCFMESASSEEKLEAENILENLLIKLTRLVPLNDYMVNQNNLSKVLFLLESYREQLNNVDDVKRDM